MMRCISMTLHPSTFKNNKKENIPIKDQLWLAVHSHVKSENSRQAKKRKKEKRGQTYQNRSPVREVERK